MTDLVETVVLQDGDLRLRPARLPGDIQAAVPWYSDPEVMLFSEGDADARYDTAMIEKMYQYLSDIGELYIIEVQQEGRWLPVGDVTLARDTLPIVIGVAEYRSRGYGKRAVRLLVDRARALSWRQLKVKSIRVNNLRSRRLFESLGFVQEGGVFLDEGQPCWRFVKKLDA